MTEKEIAELFIAKKALLKGHFLLSSGLHSDTYFQCALILQYPEVAEMLARELVTRFRKEVSQEKIDIVVSPALGGIIIGHEVAKCLNCRALFCERENGIMKLRRGFSISPQEKCLIVEDVITTGLSTTEVIKVVDSAKANLQCILAIVDRSSQKLIFSVPVISLMKLTVSNYKPENCPLCYKNITLVKPGSRNC